MIMNNSKKINQSKKRNMNEFMSQGILEVEKVLNESQHFQSIHDPEGLVDEAAELQQVLDMKYSEKNDETQIDLWNITFLNIDLKAISSVEKVQLQNY